MYCEFIRQIIQIVEYGDFQDIQTVVLPTLRFEEIERIYKLFISDKESQRIAKAEIEINLEKALNIYQNQETKIFEIQEKINQFVRERNSSSVEFLENQFNELRSLLIELSEFISDCFDMELKYYPEIFQEPNRIELMQHFVPVYNENRIKFEADILRPKGRKKEKKKDLFDYLTDPEKYSYIIPKIREQYRNKTATDIFFMIYALIKLEIFEKDTFLNISHLQRILRKEFKEAAGSRQYYQKLYADEALNIYKQDVENHIEKIKEIALKK